MTLKQLVEIIRTPSLNDLLSCNEDEFYAICELLDCLDKSQRDNKQLRREIYDLRSNLKIKK